MDADATRLEQEILDEHLEGFRALFDTAAIGMATMTVHATIVRANDALADLCRASRGSWSGSTTAA